MFQRTVKSREVCSRFCFGKRKQVRDKSIRVKRGDNVSYTVPQVLSRADTGFEKFPVSFRVREPLSNVKVVLKGDDEVLYESKIKKIIRPGEMERLMIDSSIYDKVVSSSKKTVTVEVQR